MKVNKEVINISNSDFWDDDMRCTDCGGEAHHDYSLNSIECDTCDNEKVCVE